MVAPLVAGALIGGASSLIGGITGGKGAKTAAKIAAQSAAADRAQAQQIYQTNMGLAQPTLDRGNAAGAQINALLGLGGDAAGAQDALATFRNASGYQDTLNSGLNAVNTGYAARGALESGAAQKALAKYGANLASGTFGQYVNALQGQQQAGAGALGAATGAGNVFAAQNMQANNNQSTAAANAALYSAQSQQNALAGIAGSAGNYFGQLDYQKRASSYAAPTQNALPYGISTPSPFSGTFALNPWGR
jgi:hypothetical protein